VVLVDFWGTWCPPCVAEIPNIKAAYAKYHKRGFEVVGISADKDRETLEAFVRNHEIPWINLFEDDADGEHPVAKKYGIHVFPTPILVNREGIVVSTRAMGENLSKLLDKHLAEKAEVADPKEEKAEPAKPKG
jgi:peroxiredoxin